VCHVGLAKVAYASYHVKVNVQTMTFASYFQMFHGLKVDKTAVVIGQLFLAMSLSYEVVSWLS